MGPCKNHPEVTGAYFCAKYRHYLCEECLHCSDPEFYCTFRSACVVHFLARERKRQENETEKGTTGPSDTVPSPPE